MHYRFNRVIALVAALCALVLLAAAEVQRPEYPDRYGIGVTLVQAEDSTFIEIRGCAPNGPAARAGIEAGDRIVELDGQSVDGWEFTQVIDYVHSNKPLPLRLKVRRGRELLTFEVTRMRISDIFAQQGLQLEKDSTGNFRIVPMQALPQLNVGEKVPFDSLLNPACQPGTVYSSSQNTVVYFWAMWCGPCKALMKRLPVPGHRYISINVDRNCGDLKAALATVDPVGEEFWGPWFGPLSQLLGIHRRGIPTAVLIDPDGRLIRIATGVDPILKMIWTEPPASLKPVFVRAGKEFDVPPDIVMAVAYAISTWVHHGEPSPMTGECGVMGLQTRSDQPTPIKIASGLIGLPPDSLQSLEANVRGGTALLAYEFVQVHGAQGMQQGMQVVENWRPVLARYTRYHSDVPNEIAFKKFSECLEAHEFGDR